MKISLKKFQDSPYKYIKFTPLTLVLNKTPKYVIIPIEEYREKIQEKESEVKITTDKDIAPRKHTRLFTLLFD